MARISLEICGVASWRRSFRGLREEGRGDGAAEEARRRREARQRERRKRRRTTKAPAKIPMTTHSLRPKIAVCFESWLLTNALSQNDILNYYLLFFDLIR